MGNYSPLKPKPDNRNPRPEDQFSTDVKVFANYIRNSVTGVTNAATQLTKGDNGAVIPETIANKIIEKVTELSPLYAKATKYPGKGTLNIPYADSSTDDITVAYATEFSRPGEPQQQIRNYSADRLSVRRPDQDQQKPAEQQRFQFDPVGYQPHG